jgi:hypothetical protein
MNASGPPGCRRRSAQDHTNVTSLVRVMTSAQAGRNVTIEAVGLGRPTQSLTLHLQQIGRALRPKPEPAIVQITPATTSHGLPTKTASGASMPRRARPGTPTPARLRMSVRAARHLPDAAARAPTWHPRPIDRRVVEEVNADLVGSQREARASRRSVSRHGLRALELARLAAARGYKPGWQIASTTRRARRRA